MSFGPQGEKCLHFFWVRWVNIRKTNQIKEKIDGNVKVETIRSRGAEGGIGGRTKNSSRLAVGAHKIIPKRAKTLYFGHQADGERLRLTPNPPLTSGTKNSLLLLLIKQYQSCAL